MNNAFLKKEPLVNVILNRIFLIYALFAFIVSFLLFFPFFLFGLLFRQDRLGLILNSYLCQFYCALIGIKVIVENQDLIDKSSNYIFCPNHFSFFDILCVPHVAMPFKFVGKLSLARIPLFGFYYRNYHILVDRESKRSSYEAYKRSINHLNDGYSLTVFPEGGIHVANSILMSKFKKGPFKMALETGVKIVPLTILDNWSIFPDDGKFRINWKRRSRLVIHEPVDPKDFSNDNLDEFQFKVHQVIQEELNQRN